MFAPEIDAYNKVIKEVDRNHVADGVKIELSEAIRNWTNGAVCDLTHRVYFHEIFRF